MKNRYFSAVLLAWLLLPSLAMAQQDPQFSQYLFNQLYLNPATAGSDGLIRFQLMHRKQYAGYQGSFDDGGAPTTQLFSAQMPLNALRSGVGLYIVNDRLGPAGNFEIQGSYAYRIPVKSGQLSLGLRGGFYNKSIDFDRLRPRQPGDPILGTGKINQTQPDLSAGAYYNSPAFFAGIAVNHLIGSQYKYGLEQATNPLKMSVYAHGGYRYNLSESVELTPSVLLKTDGASYIVTGGLMATVFGQYWLGGQWRQDDAIIAMAGLNFGRNNEYRAGVAYDFVVGGQDVKSPGSYEVLLSYALPAPKVTRKTPVRTPRFRY